MNQIFLTTENETATIKSQLGPKQPLLASKTFISAVKFDLKTFLGDFLLSSTGHMLVPSSSTNLDLFYLLLSHWASSHHHQFNLRLLCWKMRPFLAEVQEKILRMRQELHTCPKCGLRQRIEDTHQKHIRKGLWCAKCKQYKSYTHFLEARKKQCRGKIKQFHCPICHLRLTKLCIKGHIKTVHKFSSEEAKLVPQLCPAVQQGTDLALRYFRQVS